jgi:enoyl-CoA hydratase/carnithine racemase
MKKFKNIKFSINDEGVARVILNDPKTYNSLSLDTINSLLSIFKILNNDKKSKVIVIEGSGKGFSAGHNLKEIQSLSNKASYKKLFVQCSKLMLNIANHKKPIIAKVHGAAFAAGCQLIASCDLAYSSSNAIFATPGVNIGLFCSTPMVALSRKVNRKHSMKMLLTGESIKASVAKEIGLINEFFPEKKLENEVIKIAKIIISKSNFVLKIGKEAFYKQLEMPLDKAYKYTSKIMLKNMLSQDAKEGINAFLEKRSPVWKNK